MSAPGKLTANTLLRRTVLPTLALSFVAVACGSPAEPAAPPPPPPAAPEPAETPPPEPPAAEPEPAPPPEEDLSANIGPEEGSVALFNGKDLKGWVQVLDSKWVVEDGSLVARQDPKGRREGESWLLTEKDYTDFVLSLKFRVTPGGNSGVFFRDPIPRKKRLAAKDGGTGPWEAGLEANIQADNPEWCTGSIYSIGKAPSGLEKPGEWNDLKLKVVGDHVWSWVNGKVAADTTQTRSKSGAIGFQRHGTSQYKDKLVEFKDIMIKEL